MNSRAGLLCSLVLAGCASSVVPREDGAVSDALYDATPRADARVADVTTPSEPRALCGVVGFAGVSQAVPSPDGSVIALATKARQVVLLSPNDGTIVSRIEAHVGVVDDVAFSPDSSTLYSYGRDGFVRAWRIADRSLRWQTRASGVRGATPRIAASVDIVALGGNPVARFDARTGAAMPSIAHAGHGSSVGLAPAIVRFSSSGDTLAVAWGGSVELFDRLGRSLGRTLSGDLGVAHSTAYAPEVQSVAFSEDDQAVLVAVRRAYVVAPPDPTRYPVARI